MLIDINRPRGHLEIRYTMQNDNIALQLIRGSRNIDRMKEDVHHLVRMTVGFVIWAAASDRTYRALDETFDSESCKWRVYGEVGCISGAKDKIEVEFLLKESYGLRRVYISGFDGCSMWSPGSVNAVQRVYENLHVLVDGMRRKLPEMEPLLKPLLGAAEVY